jgi:hypothetical protein
VAGTVLHICGLRPMARGKTHALHRLLQRGGVSSVQVHAMTSLGLLLPCASAWQVSLRAGISRQAAHAVPELLCRYVCCDLWHMTKHVPLGTCFSVGGCIRQCSCNSYACHVQCIRSDVGIIVVAWCICMAGVSPCWHKQAAVQAVAGTACPYVDCDLWHMTKHVPRGACFSAGGVSAVQAHCPCMQRTIRFGVDTALCICIAGVAPCWYKHAGSTIRPLLFVRDGCDNKF